MENTKRKNVKIAIAIVTILLVSSAIMFISNPAKNITVQAQTTYGDVLQYEWPEGPGCDSGNTFFNPGPAPSTPTVSWTKPVSPSAGPAIAFDGQLFVYNSTYYMSLDPFSGATNWALAINAANYGNLTYFYNNASSAPRGFGTGTTFRIGDHYMGVQTGSGVECIDTDTGLLVGKYICQNQIDGFSSLGGGSVIYWGGFYSSWDKMDYATALSIEVPYYYNKTDANGNSTKTSMHLAIAFDMSDPTNPHVAWSTIMPTGVEALTSAPGLAIFGGYGEGQIFALNATTGKTVWEAWKKGNAGYIASYWDGKIYQAASSTSITCWNATDGSLIFDHDEGPRAFFVFGDAIAYGRYIGKNIALPDGIVGAWDAYTGEPLWRSTALYMIAYLTNCVADGKMWVTRYSGTAGGETGMMTAFDCYDVFTGQILWEMPGLAFTFPMVAYGNLYGYAGGQVYCISDTPAASNMWAAGNTRSYPGTPGVANNGNPSYVGIINGQTGPADISTPKWTYATGGMISGSAVADNGMVYFGSYDQYIYALNATTGDFVWKFQTGYRVSSTPAVVGSTLYTGSDDGNVYAVNALTGTLKWKRSVGGLHNAFWVSAWQARPSPVVVGDKLYVGSGDGNLYCLDTSSGSVKWQSAAGNVTYPIGGVPLVANGTVYIASSNSYLYAFDASTGTPVWARQMEGQTSFNIRSLISTPIAVNGTIWVCGGYGGLFYGLNQTTGEILVRYGLPYTAGSGSMTPAISTPAYFPVNTTSYALYVSDGFELMALNITRLALNRTQVNGYNLYYTNMSGTYYIDPYYTNRTVTLADGRVFQNLTQIATAIINSYPTGVYVNRPETPLPSSIYDHIPGVNATLRIPQYAAAVNATTNHNVYWNQFHPIGVGDPLYFNGTYYYDMRAYYSGNRTIAINARPNIGYLPIGNESYLPTIWEQWLGHQLYSSPIYVNDLTTPKIYVGDDVFAVTCFNATSGRPLSAYSTKGQVFATACVYDGHVYIGSQDGSMYCFGKVPAVSFSLSVASNKGAAMWSNETITIAGRLTPAVTSVSNGFTDYGTFAANGLPNATILVTFTKPDMSSLNLTTTTDRNGAFSISYNPNVAGDWGWVAWYPGEAKAWSTYGTAYSEWNPFTVTAPTSTPATSPSPSPSPSPAAGTPVEYIYAAVAVIVIVIIAIGAYAYTRRSKK
jgi:outer membrane protein assembly factor BamB